MNLKGFDPIGIMLQQGFGGFAITVPTSVLMEQIISANSDMSHIYD